MDDSAACHRGAAALTWILDESELVLRSYGYSTLRLSHPDCLAFEDEALLGFVIDYPSVASINERWSADQMSLLSRFSPALRVAREKSWNVYVCLFSELAPMTPEERFELEEVEGDLRNTRKVPRHTIKTPADVRTSLSPVLPILSRAQIERDSFESRLAKQLSLSVPEEASDLFLSDAEENVVAYALIEASQ